MLVSGLLETDRAAFESAGEPPWLETIEDDLAPASPGLRLDGEVRFAEGDFI